MAISGTRLNKLLEDFKPTKAKIEDIDRKYNLDYVEPKLDMPESLDLPKLTFTPKTTQELQELAREQVEASYLADIRRLESSRANSVDAINRKNLALEEKTRKTQAKYLADYTAETERVNNKLVNNGMLFSSVLDSVKRKAQKEYESNVAESNTQAEAQQAIYDAERQAVEDNYNAAKLSVEEEREAKETAAYNKLSESDKAEGTRVAKYNNQLDEKEKRYKFTRARALESIRLAEYSRAFAARKLYVQMGSVGYEETMLWEKYNVFVQFFSTVPKHEEAMAVVNIDNFVRGHLKHFYSTLLDWIDRNIPY